MVNISSSRWVIRCVRDTRLRAIGILVMIALASISSVAQETVVKKLKILSIEELMDIKVTSVTRRPQKLTEVASAIQVITHDDIMRSGATNIPEALRLSPNLQVAQVNSNAWIISARGFNTVFANKLLVLIDGRTVYTPLFGGVLWELQSVLLEDVNRIEIISGPGATLWGANAVNGVINIITKGTKDTQGLYVSAAGGNFLNHSFAARYGNHVGEKFFYRVYAQTSDRAASDLADGTSGQDSWWTSQAGFRMGMYPTTKDYITVQGDVYQGSKRTQPQRSPFDGQNVLGRWTHTINEESSFVVQAYYDRYWRDDPGTADQQQTFDVDVQHRFPIRKVQSILWGVGYRTVYDEVTNRNDFAGLVPPNRTMPLYSGFLQDEIAVRHNIKVTVGSKFLDNVFSGFEIQPSLRAAWALKPNATLWAAISKAVRAPSRFDVDYRLPIQPQPPDLPSVIGSTNFQSEKLYAYELGYKIQPSRKLSLALATFYNEYKDVYSVETIPGTQTYLIQNGSVGESWGGEFSGLFQALPSWRLRGGFTYFAKDLRAKPGHLQDPSYLGNDAKHHFVVQSMLDLPFNLHFDLIARYLDYIPASFATTRVSEYCTFDARFSWTHKFLDIALAGQNLLTKEHAEFGTQKIPRSIYGKITCRF